MKHWRNIRLLSPLPEFSDNLKDLLRSLYEKHFIYSYEEYHIRRTVSFFILMHWEKLKLLKGGSESVKRSCLMSKNKVSKCVKSTLQSSHLKNITRTEIEAAQFYYNHIIDFFMSQVCPSHSIIRSVECIDQEKD